MTRKTGLNDREYRRYRRERGRYGRDEELEAAAGRALAAAAGVAALVALAPVALVAAAGYLLAWSRGWTPRRLYAGAAWALGPAAYWLAVVALWTPPGLPGSGPGPWWLRLAAASFRAWLVMAHLAIAGSPRALLAVPPVVIPAGLAAAGRAWDRHLFLMTASTGGRHPAAPAGFDWRMWRHQSRAARRAAGHTRAGLARSGRWRGLPGPLPLALPGGDVVVGATIRAAGDSPGPGRGRRRDAPEMTIPHDRLRSHQVVVGTTGTGKTTLLLRLWTAFMAVALRRAATGRGRRPLLVVIDCKGGDSSREIAARAGQALRAAGAGDVRTWPADPLSLWTLPPGQLVTTLLDLIEHGDGAAAYYQDMMRAVVSLAVGAPPGPPASAAEFLGRLRVKWLSGAYQAAGDAAAASAAVNATRVMPDVEARLRALLDRLGPGLDGKRRDGKSLDKAMTLAEGDAWYCVLEGTAAPEVAEAQARALVDLLASYAVGGEREILLCIDEFSAVSRRLPIWRLYERARSLGLAVQVSAQSWEGLGNDDDERRRVASTAEGGVWLLRTPQPDRLVDLAGQQPAIAATRQQSGRGSWEPAGTATTRPVPVVDPQLIRRLTTGQAAYIYQGTVTFVHVQAPVRSRPPRPDRRPALREGPASARPGPVEPGERHPDSARPASIRPVDAGRREWPPTRTEPGGGAPVSAGSTGTWPAARSGSGAGARRQPPAARRSAAAESAPAWAPDRRPVAGPAPPGAMSPRGPHPGAERAAGEAGRGEAPWHQRSSGWRPQRGSRAQYLSGLGEPGDGEEGAGAEAGR
jgi:hypothetical protein